MQATKYPRWSKLWPNLLAAAITLLVVLPFVWLILMSFKDKGEILSSPIALPGRLLSTTTPGCSPRSTCPICTKTR